MFHKSLFTWLIVSVVLTISGCGVVEEEYDGAARLVVTAATTDKNKTPLQFYSGLGTNDDPDTASSGEFGEGNFIPEVFLGEEITQPIEADLVKFSFFNEPRLGIEDPVDIVVESITFQYFDAFNNQRSFAPDRVVSATALVPAEGSADLSVQLIPFDMKIPDSGGGLSDIFLYGISQDGFYANAASEIAAASQWTVVAEVRAKDYKNNDIIKVYDSFSVYFMDPMKGTIGED